MRPGPHTVTIQVRVYPREPGGTAAMPSDEQIARALAVETVGLNFDVPNNGDGSAWIVRAAKAKAGA